MISETLVICFFQVIFPLRSAIVSFSRWRSVSSLVLKQSRKLVCIAFIIPFDQSGFLSLSDTALSYC